RRGRTIRNRARGADSGVGAPAGLHCAERRPAPHAGAQTERHSDDRERWGETDRRLMRLPDRPGGDMRAGRLNKCVRGPGRVAFTDPVLGQWERHALALTDRSEVAGVVLSDRIYVVGGFTARFNLAAFGFQGVNLKAWSIPVVRNRRLRGTTEAITGRNVA